MKSENEKRGNEKFYRVNGKTPDEEDYSRSDMLGRVLIGTAIGITVGIIWLIS